MISQGCTAACPQLPVETGIFPLCETEWLTAARDSGLASHIRAVAISGDALIQIRYCSSGASLLCNCNLQTASLLYFWTSALHRAELG